MKSFSNKHFSHKEVSIEKLQKSLMRPGEIGSWLVGSDNEAFEIFGNTRAINFFNHHFDGHNVKRRFLAYNKDVERDKDRVRLHGKYYNNIYLGKRIFGPARKQVFNYTVVGGMERRFEIIDNQINHIQFTHEFSDKYRDKCRNSHIKCRDDTRVVLRFPPNNSDDFIHANYIKSSALFNDFILTQAPLNNTIGDFWRMVWQEKVCYIFMLISRKDASRCVIYWPRKANTYFEYAGLRVINEGIEPEARDPFFRITRILVIGPDNKELRLEHWQADMNNSENVEAPLRLLRLARGCTRPTIVHDYLGVSRAACLVAAEICIVQLIRGPLYKHPVQRAVHYLRSMRSFSIETPMQYIFIHRVVQHFVRPLVGIPRGFAEDYARWLDERSQRLFVDDCDHSAVPAFRLLSPKVDPDLLPLVRHRERPECRREMHALIGELPLPAERFDVVDDSTLDENDRVLAALRTGKPTAKTNNLTSLHLPKRYPRGKRY